MIANIKATALRLKQEYSGNTELILVLDKESVGSAREAVDAVRDGIKAGKVLAVDIAWWRRKRSLDANAFMWTVCQKLADKLHSTKVDVYRAAIQDKGVFEIVPIRNDAVQRYISSWQKNGLGWIAEVQQKSKIDGYTNVVTYYGSSDYDSKEMSLLLDYLIEQARGMGIPILSESEIDLLKREWNDGR